MPEGQRAARVTDPVCHGLGMFGLLEGALIGAAIGVAMIAALPAEATFMAAATVGAAAIGTVANVALLGEKVMSVLETYFGLTDPTTGTLDFGSPNVRIGSLRATRVLLDVAGECSGAYNHLPSVEQIAEGSGTVLINRLPAARVASKLFCGARVKDGCATVIIGGPTAAMHAIEDNEKKVHEFAVAIKEAADETQEVIGFYKDWRKTATILRRLNPRPAQLGVVLLRLTGEKAAENYGKAGEKIYRGIVRSLR